ncbi:MAG TPA: DUF1553 domain-containing protein [Candidatus Acidoferrum sp.]|jgi:hypothetical protein|nr:DUF1553 domain-containing protein [Candidatus Acidoferrum sp.]
MSRTLSKVGTFAALSLLAVSLCSAAPADGALRFNRDIRPILSDRCFKCHGPDPASRKAKLRLDDPKSAFAARGDPAEYAIVPGKPNQSALVRRIFSTDPDDVMPRPDSHLKLTDGEKRKLRQWIAEGAKYEPHWAFIPPAASVPVPAVKDTSWPRNEIDRFVLAALERAGLKPSREADKARWLRRVTYDLNGLPPTPAEVDAFLVDDSPGAWGKVVDRLQASKRFGERMAVPWLDGARFADSYGYQSDQLCPTWPYRDWVVDAFNRSMPFDRFLTEQLAGDLLPNATPQQRLATAFNRLHRQTNEGGSVEEEWRNEYVSDRVQTFSSVFLGLTFECARCHDHKFDPISQRDYYSLSAFFNSIDEYGTYDNSSHVPTPSILLPTPEQEKAMAASAEMLQEKRRNLLEALTNSEESFSEWLKYSNHEPAIAGLIGRFTFDAVDGTNRFLNEADSGKSSEPLAGNTLVPGKYGQAVSFSGDDQLNFPGLMTSVEPWDQYSLVFWLHLPKTVSNGVVFHCTQGTDTGYYGTELSLRNGRLIFVIKRFWPGNALAVQTLEPVAHERWMQVGVTYDGSGAAGGMRLFVDGRPAPVEILRKKLYKSPETTDAAFHFGARFRSYGLKDGKLDDLRVYNRPLTPIEVAQLFDGHSLLDAPASADTNRLRDYYLGAIADGVARARKEQAAAVHQFFQVRNPVQETSIMEELPTPRETYVLARGRYDAPKNDDTRVTRSTPSFLPPLPAGAPCNRLGLAEWLIQPTHPLTARVIVNRYWQMLFGRGIVATPENFGAQGAAPTHPKLLDWLARDFISSGWNTKALLKKIVLSATYRQDSVLRPDLREKDPENLLLARGPSQRLPAEMIRDTALAASGLLDEKLGGPPVSPYLPGDLWRESNDMSPAYHQSVGGDLYRRSVYTVWKRTAPMPDMTAFDAPSREVCLLKRSPTSTPQQAFVLLNDAQYVEAARVLAERMLTQAGPQQADEIAFAFRRLTGRKPLPEETRLLGELFQEARQAFREEPERAAKLLAVGEKKPDPKLNESELAAATEVTQAILNLDATGWKR